MKTNGQGVLWLNTSSLYLSPNNDGRKETLIIDIVVSPDIGPWELSVAGLNRTILRNTGTQLGFEWDIKDKATGKSTLPDGSYTLVLTSKGREKTKQVIIDTEGPTTKLMIDGAEFPDIIDNQLPKIEATIADSLSGIKGQASIIGFEFSKRQDDQTPVVYEDRKLFDEQRRLFSYRVPPEENAVLYGGDQSLTLRLEDKAENRSEITRPFAVGEHSLWSFDPDVRSAYRTSPASARLLTVAEAEENPRLRKYASPNYRIIRLDPDRVIAEEISPEESRPISEPEGPPRVFPNPKAAGLSGWASLFLIVNSISGDTVGYVYMDREEESIKKLIKKGRTFRVDVGDIDGHSIGTIDVNDKTFDHVERHVEIGPSTLARALLYLKNRDLHSAEIELWNSPQSADPIDDALVMKYRGVVWWIPFKTNDSGTGGARRVVTSYSPLRGYKGRGYVSFSSLEHQWMYVTDKIAEFYRLPISKVTNAPLAGEELTKWIIKNGMDGKIFSPTFYNHSKPDYPRWIFGNIYDPQKPYSIDKRRRKAIADRNKTLIDPDDLKRP